MTEYVNIYNETIAVDSVVSCTVRASLPDHREWGIVEALNGKMSTALVRDLDRRVAWFGLEVLRLRPGYDEERFRRIMK